jgi:hypothetical protein
MSQRGQRLKAATAETKRRGQAEFGRLMPLPPKHFAQQSLAARSWGASGARASRIGLRHQIR